MDKTLDEIEALLNEDPGNPAFVECAERYRALGDYANAFERCFAGLSANPSNHQGRLLLARLFYEKGYIAFAVRELELLAKHLPDNNTVKRLLEKLAPGSSQQLGETTKEKSGKADDTVAEAEFDFDTLEKIEDDQ